MDRNSIGFQFKKYLEVIIKPIFEIENLKCSYQTSKRPVLEIDSLAIEKNSMVFFIGASGSGKSTILESLGLMNNTVVNDPRTKFTLNLADKSVDLLDAWTSSKTRTELRNQLFSFIFQSNNLFDSMSGYQNIMSGALINGVDEITLLNKTNKIVKRLLSDLNKDDFDDFNIKKMSGGQRQRVAFARAIIAEKEILFADEPTGNLDWFNAREMMNFIAETLNQNKGTAIIVTHDVELAMEYATKIVVVDKKLDRSNNNETYYGKISSDCIYNKDGELWNNQNKIKTNKDVLVELKDKFL